MIGYHSIPDKIGLTEKAWWRNLHVSPSTAELLRYSKRSWVHVRMDHVQCFQCKGKKVWHLIEIKCEKLTGGLLGQLQNPLVGPSEVKEDSSFLGRTFSWHQRSPDTSRRGSIALLPEARGYQRIGWQSCSVYGGAGTLLDHCGEEKAEARQCVTMAIKQCRYVACQQPAAAMKLTVP